jgi:hypothetical protein
MGMVFNATFSNISDISWLSDLLEEETGVPQENHRPAASHWHDNLIIICKENNWISQLKH